MATIYVGGGGAALRNAIVNCSDGDEIVVGDGTYTGVDYTPNTRRRFSVRSENGPVGCMVKFAFGHNASNGDRGDIRITGITFDAPSMRYSDSFRWTTRTFCIQRGSQTNYDACGGYSVCDSCLFIRCAASNGRLADRIIATNCAFVECVIAGGTLNYNSTFRNCLFAGNARTAGGTPLTNYGAASSNPNCMAGAAELVDANGRPVSGSPAYGGGSATYLTTPTDLVGTPWRNPPAIGCYELMSAAIKPTIPTRMLPFGV